MAEGALGTVVVLSEQYRPKVGGAVRYVDGLVSGLLQGGCSVKLLVPAAGDVDVAETWTGARKGHGTARARLEVVEIHARGDVHGEWSRTDRRKYVDDVGAVLEERMDEWEPTAIHVAYGHYLYGAVQGISRVPTFWTVHNVPPAESQKWLTPRAGRPQLGRQVHEFAYRLCSALVNRMRISLAPYTCIVAVSDHVAEKLQYLPFRSDLTVIGEGFTEGCCTVKAVNTNGNNRIARGEELSLLTVAGVVPHKGQHLAVEAAKILFDQGVSFTWRFVGPLRNRGYAEDVRHQIESQDLTDSVELEGTVSQERLCRFYSEADVYIQTSLEEGYCLSVLEALAHGTPVVGTSTGAIRELVAEGVGHVAEGPKPSSIAGAIVDVAEREWTAEQRKALARRIRDRFSWSKVAEEMIDLYRNYR